MGLPLKLIKSDFIIFGLILLNIAIITKYLYKLKGIKWILIK